MCWKTWRAQKANTNRASSNQYPCLCLLPKPCSTLDDPKVEVMTPDVTNQADKEQGLLWTDTQLWVQLCVVVRPACALRDEEAGGKDRKETDRERKSDETDVMF